MNGVILKKKYHISKKMFGYSYSKFEKNIIRTLLKFLKKIKIKCFYNIVSICQLR